jgi:hypothetical protein
MATVLLRFNMSAACRPFQTFNADFSANSSLSSPRASNSTSFCSLVMASLTPQEIDTAKHVFERIDLNHNNSLDFLELRSAFDSKTLFPRHHSNIIYFIHPDCFLELLFYFADLGHNLTDQQLFQLISQVDQDFNQVLGSLTFYETWF